MTLLKYDANNKIAICMASDNTIGSHKLAAAKGILDHEIKQGRIHLGSNQLLAVPTGGNMGVGISLMAKQHGLRTLLFVPKNYSPTKQTIMHYLGGEVIERSSDTHPNDTEWYLEIFDNRIDVEKKNHGVSPLFINQMTNIGNVQGQYTYTAKPFFDDLLTYLDTSMYDQVDLVLSMGSGGSLTAMYQAFKKTLNCPIKLIIVQPEGCSFKTNTFTNHSIQGISVGMTPHFFNKSKVNEYISVSSEDAKAGQDWLLEHHALLNGLSSGANMFAALKVSKTRKEQGINSLIITMNYDTGIHYCIDES